MGRAKEQISFDELFYNTISILSLAECITTYRRIFDVHTMSLNLHMRSQDIHDFLYEAEKRGYLALLPDKVVSPVRKKLVWIQRGRLLSTNKTSFVLNNLYVLTKKGVEKFAELYAKRVEDTEPREEAYKEAIGKMDKIMLSIDALRSDPALLVREYAISNLITNCSNENSRNVKVSQSSIREYIDKLQIKSYVAKLPDFLVEVSEYNTLMGYILTGFEDESVVKQSVRILSRYGDITVWYLSERPLSELGFEFKYLFELDKDATVKTVSMGDYIEHYMQPSDFIMWLIEKEEKKEERNRS